ncbi:MAG: DUF6364 family protein [Candidatus Margulisbacteria bacterium]|jgi:hypothetical protein|nr:DUF6364 family protein [Candidatus Margulisiibacteriota bacterium]
MYTKLTLNIDKAVVEKAKIYARHQQRSISRLVEEYLASISAETRRGKEDLNPGPITKKIAGIINIDKTLNYKEVLTEALLEKYL